MKLKIIRATAITLIATATTLILLSVSIAGIQNLDTGTFSVGLHVQSMFSQGIHHVQSMFHQGFNEAYVNTATARAPEPAMILLFGAGLIGLTGFVRKKQK